VEAILANALILGLLVVAAVAVHQQPDYYYTALQGDRFVEWASFWAFLLAAIGMTVAAARQWRRAHKVPWFLTLVALFCLFVAGEEISWGQRLLGFQSPTYFQEQNFQQEVNLHNVVGTSLRKLAFKGLIAGYGIVLPLVALIGPVRRALDRLGIVSPPVALVPSFLAMLVTYQLYPWKFTGELVEVMLALALLFAATSAVGAFANPRPQRRRVEALRPVLIGILVIGLGIASTAISRHLAMADPSLVEMARLETEALRRDYLGLLREGGRGDLKRCGLHKRLYSYVKKYQRHELQQGAFARLSGEVQTTERGKFFLDPWNSPYWIRQTCGEDRSDWQVLIYSFGPNRMRDSDRERLHADDIGAMVHSQGSV
jgi:hypothetical protein